jgi:hypothetical protein
VDAMSDAIEAADVMLYGVSLRYKESANVRRSHNASCSTTNSLKSIGSLTLARACVPRAQCRMGTFDSSGGDIVRVWKQ